MLPGKGVHLVMNNKILTWVNACLEDVANCYDDTLHDSDPGQVLDNLLGLVQEEYLPWVEEKDNFGRKAIRKMLYKKGELRVTVILTKQNELRLDIREWYEPQS